MKSTFFRSLAALASSALLMACPVKDDLTKATKIDETKTLVTESKTDIVTTDVSELKPKLNSIHLSKNQLAILGENLDTIKNLSIEGVALKIVSQSSASIAAEAMQALKLVLGATHDLIFTTAYAEGKVSIYVEIPEGLLKNNDRNKESRFVIKDGDKVLGYFMNTVDWTNNNSAAVMLPTKEIVVVSLITGQFDKISYIYFSDTNCQGTAYTTGNGYSYMNVLNRIFIGRYTGDFFKAVDVKEGQYNYSSYTNGMYGCRNFTGARNGHYSVLQSIEPIPDFSSIAPIQIDLE